MVHRGPLPFRKLWSFQTRGSAGFKLHRPTLVYVTWSRREHSSVTNTWSSTVPSPSTSNNGTLRQGLTFAHFRAQLEDLRNTSLTSELNMSTFGTHPRVNMGHMEDKVSLS